MGSGSHFHFDSVCWMGSGLDWSALRILQNCGLRFGLRGPSDESVQRFPRSMNWYPENPEHSTI